MKWKQTQTTLVQCYWKPAGPEAISAFSDTAAAADDTNAANVTKRALHFSFSFVFMFLLCF